ncbi:MAG: hypothetical protein IT374_24020 [Polyangiaceae bacterium]|nr:hypothetical protein [Polyangiaceae bacterium]
MQPPYGPPPGGTPQGYGPPTAPGAPLQQGYGPPTTPGAPLPPGGYGTQPQPPPGGPVGGYLPAAPGAPLGGQKKIEPLAIVSLVAGLVGLPAGLCCSWFALAFTLVAVGTGAFALVNISNKPNELGGKGLAIGGIIAGLAIPAMLIAFVFLSVAFLSLPAIFG